MKTHRSQADMSGCEPSGFTELQQLLAQRERTVREQLAQLEQLHAELDEQKLAARNQSESEQHWRELAQTSPVVLFTVGADGTILFINRAFPGYPPVEQIIGTHVNQWIPAEQQRLFAEVLRSVLQTGEISSYEIASRRPDGGEDWWLTQMGPVREDNRVVAATVVTSNITARRLTEENERRVHQERDRERVIELALVNESLRRSEQRYRAMFESAAVGVAQIARTGEFLHVNRKLCQITGHSVDELRSKSLVDLAYSQPQEGEASVAGLAQVVDGGRQEFEGEMQWVHHDGRVIWVRVHATSLRGSQGNAESATIVVQDITDRKWTEESLADEMGFAALRAGIGEALNVGSSIYAGLQPTCEMLIRYFDAAFARIWTLNSANNILELQANAGLDTHIDGPHTHIPIGHFKLGLFSGEVQSQTHNPILGHPAIPRQDWDKVEGTVAFAGYPLVVEGHVVGTLALFTRHALKEKVLLQLASVADVVAQFIQRKRTEEELRHLNSELEVRIHQRTAQLEAANKEMEAFCYSVSHDLRAPLRALDGFSEILQRNFASQLPAEASRLISRVRGNAQQMGQLIDDLLAFSRLGRQTLHQQVVDLGDLIRRSWEELATEREGRHIEFRLGELPKCQGDPGLLKQVFVNLLSNALKYSRKRDPAIIEVGSQSGGQRGECVCFIKDNGVGFDMRYKHKLFGVFQRLHRAEDYEGTGVGLALVQRIIQRHGGRIWASAEPNQGAIFSFTLQGASP